MTSYGSCSPWHTLPVVAEALTHLLPPSCYIWDTCVCGWNQPHPVSPLVIPLAHKGKYTIFQLAPRSLLPLSKLIFRVIYSLSFPTHLELFADPKHPSFIAVFCFPSFSASPAGCLYGIHFPDFLLLPEKSITPFPHTITFYSFVQWNRLSLALLILVILASALCILCVCLCGRGMYAHKWTHVWRQEVSLRHCPWGGHPPCFLS